MHLKCIYSTFILHLLYIYFACEHMYNAFIMHLFCIQEYVKRNTLNVL